MGVPRGRGRIRDYILLRAKTYRELDVNLVNILEGREEDDGVADVR